MNLTTLVNYQTPAISSPSKFLGLYWNLKENQPSQPIEQLISLLLQDLNLPLTLDAIVNETQSKWLQRVRWDVKQDSPFILERKEKIEPLLERLGLTSSIEPQDMFDTALLLAGRANIFIARCSALAMAIKEQSLSVRRIDVLTGKHSLHPLELEILKNSAFGISNVSTEEEMTQVLSERIFQPLGIICNIIATDLGERKPSTEQTIYTWLDKADRRGESAVIVSDPQFAVYQYLQCMDALYKRNVSDINLDLLAKQLEPSVFKELNISMEETQENPILLHLDTIARTLYTLKSQINRGVFNEK